jgi:hypothetical protein
MRSYSVTGIFPLGGRVGEKRAVTLTGWNLPEKSLVTEGAETGVTTLKGDFFNEVPFAVDDLPEVFELKPDDSMETAQPVTLPIIINGHIAQAGGRDVFQFTGKGGQQVVAEVFAGRLDSPLDSFLRLTDGTGKILAFSDDHEDKGSGLNTHHADSYLTATLPADGTYFVQITDTEGHGGPDFELRVVPSSLSLRTGMSAPLTVFALRRDGFTNAIDLKLRGAAAGFGLSGARIQAGQDKAQFTLKAPPDAVEKPVSITMEGEAMLGGKLVVHAAVPAEDMMQAFIYRHLVPSTELAVTVNGQARMFQRDSFKILSGTPVKIPFGGTAHIQISTPSEAFANRFKLELDNAPAGISLESVTPSGRGVELAIRCEAEKEMVGSAGNLICNVVPKNEGQDPKRPGKQVRRVAVAALPAIPYQVIAE